MNEHIDSVAGYLKPESALERTLLNTPEFKAGLDWGFPRFGHPEGKVIYHIREVLDNVAKIKSISSSTREKLRLICFSHDTFKFAEDKDSVPRDWTKHHGVLARKFMETYIDDLDLLNIIELHDEAYYCWRLEALHHRKEESQERIERLRSTIKDFQLYYLFFKCDTKTGDKNQAPLKWFEKTMTGLQIEDF